MAIALVGTAQLSTKINGQDPTITFDVGPSEDDVVVVFGGHGKTETTLTAPGSGYTLIAEHTGSAPIFGAWYKVMGATPDTTVLCDGGGNAADAVVYCSYVFSGVDSTVLDQTTVTVGPTGSSNPNCGSITTQTDNAWVLALAGSTRIDSAVGTPTGYSNLIDADRNDTEDITVAGCTKTVSTAGAEDPAAYPSWLNGTWFAITVALKEAGAAAANPKGPLGMPLIGPFGGPI